MVYVIPCKGKKRIANTLVHNFYKTCKLTKIQLSNFSLLEETMYMSLSYVQICSRLLLCLSKFYRPVFVKNQFLIFLVDQFILWSTKNHFLMFLVDQFFFGRPKKLEIDRTIGIPKRLTKSTWTPL